MSLNLGAVIIQTPQSFNLLSPIFSTHVLILITNVLFSIASFSIDLTFAIYYLGCVSESVFLIALANLRAQGRKERYAYISFAKFTLFLTFVYVSNNLTLSYIISNLVVSICLISRIVSVIFNPKLYSFLQISSLKFGAGLLPHQVGQWVSNSGGRFILGTLAGTASLAYFTQAISASILVIALNSALIIYIPRLLVDNYEAFLSNPIIIKLYTFIKIYTVFIFFIVVVFYYMDSDYYQSKSERGLNFEMVKVAFLCSLAYLNYTYYLTFVNYLFYFKDSIGISTITIKYCCISAASALIMVSFFYETGLALSLWWSSILYVFLTANKAIKYEERLLAQLKTYISNVYLQSVMVITVLTMGIIK